MFARVFANIERFIQRQCHAIAVTGAHSPFDARRIDVDAEKDGAIQRRGEWLGAAHAAHAARHNQLAGKIAAEVFVGHGGKRFKRALNDALRADVDPTAGRHLAVHHQAAAFEFVKVFPVGPRADKI